MVRTKIEQTKKALKGYTKSYEISIKNDKDPLIQHILSATPLFTLYSAVVSAAQARLDVCSACSTLLNLRVNAVFPLYWSGDSA